MLPHWCSMPGLRLAGAAVASLSSKVLAGAAARISTASATRVRADTDILQHAIDIARDGMAVFDRDLRLVAWNRAYADICQMPVAAMRKGVTLQSLIRSSAERGIYGPVDVEDYAAARLDVLLRPTGGLRLNHAPTGRVLEMRSVRLNSGGLFFTYSDATAQAKSEEELGAENLTLERRVRERTEELQSLNFELARAKAEAEDADLSKSRFLAAASHDLLQPLNAARLYASALREQMRIGSGVDCDHLAGNIELSLESVEEILGALLEMSQLDAGVTPIELSPIPLGALLHQLTIDFEPMARRRGLTFKMVPSSAVIFSDRRLLRRLLQNLIANAIKYTREGGILVGVRHLGGFIRIEVHDTGIGIPEAKRALIFREFERLPDAIRAAQGAGLGLSIVDRLSRVLDHEVTLTSVVGRGSAFRVRIPRAAGPTLPVSTPSPRFTSQRSLAGLTIAAIDDELDVLSGLALLLRGWECIVAAGTDLPGVEAELDRHDLVPDVIIADFHMRTLTGLDVIAALRDRFGPRPAVLITADRAPAIRDRARSADVRVLDKPLKPAALRALLSQWRLVKAASAREPVSTVEKADRRLVPS